MKKFVAVLSAAALTLTLGACGSDKEADGKGKDAITLATWGSSPAETAALENTVASFEEATGIDVVVETIQDNFPDAITARFAAKSAPDVFYLDAYLAPKFIKSGVLADLTEDLENQDDFYAPLLDAFKDEEGKVYGAPKDYSTIALYVNTELLEQAGFTTADIPKDWNGLAEFAKQLQAKLPKGVAPMSIDTSLARNMSVYEAYGVEAVDEKGRTNLSSTKGVNEYFQMLADGNKDKSLAIPKSDLGVDNAGAAFGSGKTVMMLEGNWTIGSLQKDFPDVKFEVLEAPTINGKQQTMTFTVGYAIAKDTKKYDDAIEFVKYMTNEGLEQWSTESGTLPSRASIADAMKVAENPLFKSHVAGAEYGTVWSNGPTLPVIASSFDNNFPAVFLGTATVEEALKTAEKEANDEISRQE